MTEKRYSRMTNHYGTSRTYCTGVYDNQNNRELKNASQVITELNALHEENEQLKSTINTLTNDNTKMKKVLNTTKNENEQIKHLIKEAYDNERTDLGRSVLKQLIENIGE